MAWGESLDHPGPMIVGHSLLPPPACPRSNVLGCRGQKFTVSRIYVLRKLPLNYVARLQGGNSYGLPQLHLNVDGGLLREVRMLQASRILLGRQGLSTGGARNA
jgi:hypothetical protein